MVERIPIIEITMRSSTKEKPLTSCLPETKGLAPFSLATSIISITRTIQIIGSYMDSYISRAYISESVRLPEKTYADNTNQPIPDTLYQPFNSLRNMSYLVKINDSIILCISASYTVRTSPVTTISSPNNGSQKDPSTY